MVRGMPAWMEAWSSCSALPRPQERELGGDQRAKRQSVLPEIVHAQVADLLAGITWAALRS
jgi:hypothetical protein